MDNNAWLPPLLNAGFEVDEALAGERRRAAVDSGLASTGPYEVLAAIRRGSITIIVERNTTDGPNDLKITYPAVCVVSGPKGEIACSTLDTVLICKLAEKLA